MKKRFLYESKFKAYYPIVVTMASLFLIETGLMYFLYINPLESEENTFLGKLILSLLLILPVLFFSLYLFFISKSKQIEKNMQLRLSTIEATADMILIIDKKGVIEYVNPAFTQNTGYELKDVLGKKIDEFKTGYQDDEFYKNIWDLILANKVWTGEMINHRHDGSLYPEEITITPVTDAKEKIVRFIIIKRDISKQKQVEESEKQLHSQLLQSQKLDEMGRLASGIAHDFNNHLSAIMGYSELLLNGLKKNDPNRNHALEIFQSAQDSHELTKQLSSFSGKKNTNPQDVKINELIEELEKMLRTLIREDIELNIEKDDDENTVRMDPSHLEHILVCLCSNAQDAMPKGGKILIETKNVTLDKEYVKTHVGVRVGDYVMLSVTDDGFGIPEKVREHIFEPFFTTKEKQNGDGLGLSMVYGIVQQNKGHIELYSEMGQGSTFKIYLPKAVADKKQEKEALVSLPTKKLPKGNETILVVEDEVIVRMLAVEALEQQGYRTLEASNGEEALQMAKHHKKIDLLLTDLIMPIMGGKELDEKIKELFPNIKTVFTSGYSDKTILQKGLLKSGFNFIQKPFTISSLTSQVRDVLDQKAKKVA